MRNNFLSKLLCTIAANFMLAHPLSAFTIINQTKENRVVYLQESYRPTAQNLGDLERPIPLNTKPNKLIIPAKSLISAKISHCSILVVKEGYLKGSSLRSRCFEPYSIDSNKEKEIADDWGILIIQSNENASSRINTGCSMKLVHPKLVRLIGSVDSYPKDLKLGDPSHFEVRRIRTHPKSN